MARVNRRRFVGSLAAGVGLGAIARGDQIPVEGRGAPALEAFDRIMLDVIREHAIPGGSLSLAHRGRLVYAKGFGWADVEGRVPARPETMFGLASVSKAITGITVLKLVEAGRIGLDDRAVDILRDLHPLSGEGLNPQWRAITVRQLLNHSAGFKQQPGVPLAARRLGMPISRMREPDLVRFYMSRPLDYEPGTEQHYSNFGFAMLGAVVAEVAGEPYGPAVHRLVFGPTGVRGGRVGHGEPDRPGTARRYDEQGRDLPPIDIPGASGGGWILATVEIVRLLASLDGSRGRPFLSPEIRREMLAPPPPPLKKRANGTWFGLGWDAVRQSPEGPGYLKNGAIVGVRAEIGRHPGGIDFALAFNGGQAVPDVPQGLPSAVKALEATIEGIRRWPEVDLFPEFG